MTCCGREGPRFSLPVMASQELALTDRIIRVHFFFSAALFLGTASGQFLRPAASRLLLSRLLPNTTGPSHKAPARFGSSGLSLLGAPEKWGRKRRFKNVLRIC